MSDEYAGWRRDRERDWYGRPEGRDEDRRWRDRERDQYVYGSGRPEQGWNDNWRDRHSGRGDRFGRDDWGGRYGREEWGREYGGSNYGGQGRYPGWPMGGRDESWRSYGRGYGPERDYDWRPSGYDRRDRGWWDRASDEVSSWFGDEDAERRRREDDRASHRGRGPRGYTRSDDRIREDISDRLTDNPVLDASDIEIAVASGEVTLTGSVDSRYSKRLAEDIAEDVSGVRHLQNNLRVREYQVRDSISGTASGIAESGRTSDLGRTTAATSANARNR